MGAPTRFPVFCHAVEYRIRYDKQTHGFKLLPKVENVVHDNAVPSVSIGGIGKGIQAALGEKLEGERQIPGFRLRLRKKQFTQCRQGGQRPAIAVVFV